MDLIERITVELHLPKAFRSASNGITRLHKTTFFREARLPPIQQKIVDNSVDELFAFGIAGARSNIPRFRNAERDYSEVLFLFCRLKEWKNEGEIAEIILSSFEKPAILFISAASDEFSISAARKRLSLGESNRQITEAIRRTHRLDLDSPSDLAYLQALSVAKMPLSNLFELHDAIFRSLVDVNEQQKEELDNWLRKKPRKLAKLDKFAELSRQYSEIADEVRSLESEHDQFRKDNEFGDALSIHTSISKKRKEMKRLIEVIRKTFA